MNTYKHGYIQVDSGVEIYYEEQGSGPALVFVPGWTFTTELFRNQLKHFSKTHRTIVIDPRSQGRSTITSHGHNYTTHGSDLRKFIKALDLKDVVFVAWSFGCLAVWEYVKQAGLNNVKAVVSIDLSPKPLSLNNEDWVEGPLDTIAEAYTAYMGSSAGQREFVEGYAKEVMVQRELTEDELTWILEQSLRTPYYIAGQLFASGMFSNYMKEAKQVDEGVAALNIVAEHWSKTAVAFTNKHFPNTRTEVLGGHIMFWEHTEKFNKLLANFFNTL